MAAIMALRVPHRLSPGKQCISRSHDGVMLGVCPVDRRAIGVTMTVRQRRDSGWHSGEGPLFPCHACPGLWRLCEQIGRIPEFSISRSVVSQVLMLEFVFRAASFCRQVR